jgi:anti-sigma B factor antagonist
MEADMELSVMSRPCGGCVIVQLAGVLDLATCPAVQSRLQETIDGGAHTVVLDLTQVRLIDSTALGLLMWLRQELQGRGGQVAVAGAQPIVRQVIELTSVDRLIGLYETLPAAEAQVCTGEHHAAGAS